MSKTVEELRVRDVARVKIGEGEALFVQMDFDSLEPDSIERVIEHLKSVGVSPVVVIPSGARLRLVSYDTPADGRPGQLTVRVVP